MQNDVPAVRGQTGASQRAPAASDAPLATRSVERALAGRYSAYLDEVRRLIAAGVAVMERTERVDPRVSEIVREAGLSNQAFYRHFRGKDELLLAILDDGLRRLAATLERRMGTATSPRERVRRWIEGVLAQALHPRAAAATRPFVAHRARLSERLGLEADRTMEVVKAPLRSALCDAVEAGELPGDADPERDAEAVYQLAMGWMQGRLLAGPPPEARDAEHLVAFALRGLGADPVDGEAVRRGGRAQRRERREAGGKRARPRRRAPETRRGA